MAVKKKNEPDIPYVSCQIGIKYLDGSIRSVRCKYDGSPAGVGRTIFRSWYISEIGKTTENEVDRREGNHMMAEAIIAEGDMARLGINRGQIARLNEDKHWMKPYAQVHDSLSDFNEAFKYDPQTPWCYMYMVESGYWLARPSSVTAKGKPRKRQSPWVILTQGYVERHEEEERK